MLQGEWEDTISSGPSAVPKSAPIPSTVETIAQLLPEKSIATTDTLDMVMSMVKKLQIESGKEQRRKKWIEYERRSECSQELDRSVAKTRGAKQEDEHGASEPKGYKKSNGKREVTRLWNALRNLPYKEPKRRNRPLQIIEVVGLDDIVLKYETVTKGGESEHRDIDTRYGNGYKESGG